MSFRCVPEGEVRAILQLSHGMVEFIDRYKPWPRSGRPGHPRHRPRPSGPRRLHPHQDGLRLFWRTRRQPRPPRRPARCHCPDKAALSRCPLFPAARGRFGSFYARQYLCEWGYELDGAIIMGTGFQPKALVQLARHLPGAGRLFRLGAPGQTGGQNSPFSATTGCSRAARLTTGSIVTRSRWTSTAPTSAVPLSSP